MRNKLTITFAFLSSILLLHVGCGKKGDPLPPIKHLPPASYQLAITQHGEQALIALTLPRLAQDGEPFTEEDFGKLEIFYLAEKDLGEAEREFEDIAIDEKKDTDVKGSMGGMVGGGGGIKIIGAAGGSGMPGQTAGWQSMEDDTGPDAMDQYSYRGTGTKDIFPRDVFERKAELALTIENEDADAYRTGQRFYIPVDLEGLEEEDIYEKRLYFSIKLYNRKGQTEGFSNLVALAPQVVPNPPAALEARVSQNAVSLAWTAPETMADGSELPEDIGYLVFRARDDEDFDPLPLNSKTTSETKFDDTSFEFNKTYRYVVRSVITTGDKIKASENGKETTVRPVDTFPPSAPTGLNTVKGEGEVTLIWAPSLEADLDGYYVYRSTAPESGFIKLNTLPLKKNTFSDTEPESGQTYYYKVTAVDRADPPNESEFSNCVSESL